MGANNLNVQVIQNKLAKINSEIANDPTGTKASALAGQKAKLSDELAKAIANQRPINDNEYPGLSVEISNSKSPHSKETKDQNHYQLIQEEAYLQEYLSRYDGGLSKDEMVSIKNKLAKVSRTLDEIEHRTLADAGTPRPIDRPHTEEVQ